MTLDFDVKGFCQHLKATKPPYECPIGSCGKIYRSLNGIQFHLYNYDHSNPDANGSSTNPSQKNGRKRSNWHHRQNRRSPTPPKFFRPPAAEAALSYAQAQKLVEVDVDGVVHRINICDPLPLVTQEGLDGLVASCPDENQNEAKAEKQCVVKRRDGGCANTKKKCGVSKVDETKLPEPSFRLLEGSSSETPPPRKNNKEQLGSPARGYIRFIEKSADELDEDVEYDMDEEDYAWLEIVNERRRSAGLRAVKQEVFEMLMDRLEKEGHAASQRAGRHDVPSIDEDAVCCICDDGECQNSNVILFCDLCDLAVHQECYGVPYIPEGQWLCRRCLQSPSRAVDCVLCPNKGGAFKQTDDGRWAHVVCALWVPEVGFANTVFLEPIDSVASIPAARWKLGCYICKQRGAGACIQCHRGNCYTAFHVTCAQQAGLYMKMEPVTKDTPNGTHFTVRKTAFCDAHMPVDGDGGDSGDSATPSTTTAVAGAPAGERKAASDEKVKTIRQNMRKVRKLLAERRNSEPSQPMVSVPDIPPEVLATFASRLQVQKKGVFIKRLQSYWTLKRQSRNGVPLLRRLQSTHQQRKEQVTLPLENDKRANILLEQLRYWQRLRQNLEKARLLVELIRKREKLKREQMILHQRTLNLRLQPFNVLLRQAVHQLQEIDTGAIFARPVDVKQVPDYLREVVYPMDLGTMREKVDAQCYSSFPAFRTDFELIVNNCLAFNERDTVFYRAAVKLRDQGGVVVRALERQVEAGRIDGSTGMHVDAEQPASPCYASVLSLRGRGGNDEKRHLEDQLRGLLHKMDEAAVIKNAATRTSRARTLKKEVVSLRRRISAHQRRALKQENSDQQEVTTDNDSADDTVPAKSLETTAGESQFPISVILAGSPRTVALTPATPVEPRQPSATECPVAARQSARCALRRIKREEDLVGETSGDKVKEGGATGDLVSQSDAEPLQVPRKSMKRRMSRRLSRAGIETIPDTTLLPAGGAQAAEESVVSQLKQEEVKPGRPPPAAAAGCPHQEAAPGMPPAFGKRQRRGMSLADLDVCRQVALAAAADAVPVMTTRSRASDRHGNKDEQPICKRLRRTHNALKSPRNGWQKLGSGRRSATSSVARRQRRTIGHVGDTKHLAPVVATKHVAPAVVKKQVAPAVVTKQVAPAVVTKHVAPAVVTKQVAPAVVKKQVAPAVVTMQVAPAVVTMQVAPAVVTMQVAPAVLTKHVAPAVVKKQVAPAVVKKQVAPAVVTKHVAPAVVTKQVAPAVATKQVTLAVATKQVAPAVAENEVAPAIASKQVAMAGKRRRRATGQGEPAEPRTRQRNPSLPAEMRNDEPGEAPVAEVTTPVMMQECHPSSVESSVSSRLEKESAQGEAEASGEKEDAESSGQHEPATTEKGKPAHPGRPEESSDYGVARVKDAPGVRTRRMSGRGADTSQQHSLDQDPPKRDLPASSPPEGAVSTDSTTTHKTEGGSSIVDNGCVNSTESIVTPDSSEPHVLPPPPLDGSTRQAPLEVSRRTAVLFSRKRAAVARRLLEMPLKKRVPRTRSRSGDDAATAGAPATLAVVVQDPPQPGGASMQSSPRHANSLRAVVTAVAAAVASPPGSPVGSPKMPTSPHTSQGAAAAGAVKVIAPARVKVTAMRVKEESTNVKGPSSPFALSEPSSTTRTHSSAVVAAEGAGERTRRRSMSGHTADTSAGNFPLLQKALGMNGFDSSRQKKDRRGRAVSVSESEGGVSSISSCSSCSDIDFQNSTFSGSECGSGDGGGGTGPGGTKNSGWQRVEDPGESNHLPFNSLDLVWAKCRGYPWYPALVIDPNVPKRSVCQNGEAIPAPPAYVLEMRQNYATPVFLVLFFDARRTWQWLPRDKIEHLGGDACLDRTKVYESKKPAERKAVKKAFDKAMQHRLLMTNSNSLPLDPTHPDAPGC